MRKLAACKAGLRRERPARIRITDSPPGLGQFARVITRGCAGPRDAARARMRINISSREIRSALDPFKAAAADLAAHWHDNNKLVHFVAYRAFADTAGELGDELEHPNYDHVRAVRLSREMFDHGLAFLEILDEEPPTDDTRKARGAALAFMETVAKYLSPLAGLRAA